MAKTNYKITQASELPIYRDTFELVSLIIDYAGNFKKCYQYSLGDKLIKDSLCLFEFLQKAHHYKDDHLKKYEILNDYLNKFESIKSILRLCTEKKLISIKQTALLAQYSECITKQINGWKNIKFK